MSLNPFIKVKLYCPVSAEVALGRLREVTQKETPWTFTAHPLIRYQSSGKRYIGVVKGNKFRLFVKPYVPAGHTATYLDIAYARLITLYRDTILAIKGTIEPNGRGCTVHLTFQPKGVFLLVLPTWMAYMVYSFINLIGRNGVTLLDTVPLIFLGVALFMCRIFYFSSYALEKDYLENLLTAQQLPTDSPCYVSAGPH